MDLAVLFPETPNPSTLRAMPKDLLVTQAGARDSLEWARELPSSVRSVLVVETNAQLGAQAFSVARSLDSRGGILGGCANEADGSRRFGSVFASVPFGPYEVEPFAVVYRGETGAAPGAEAIDAVVPGAYLVDRAAFVDAGGFEEAISSPWRVYDLCARLRARGKPVRWDSTFSFVLEGAVPASSDASDHRNFMRAWGASLAARFDLETPARGTIRRTVRLPLGQREMVTIPLPPTDVVLCGDGPLTPNRIRASTRAHRLSVRDARGEPSRALGVLGKALRGRSDRYLAVIDAAAEIEDGWLERILVELEARPALRGIRHASHAVLALPRIPLDVQLDVEAPSALQAAESLLASRRKEPNSMSVVYVAHVRTDYHVTSFEGVYGGELDIDYHVVATSSRPATLDLLRAHPTLEVIVDDSRGMATGVNAALARCAGDIIVVLGDDFYPPPNWLAIIREAFALRPEMGILGLSAVFVDGPQAIDLAYADLTAFKTAAGRRRATFTRDAKLTDRLAALVLAVDSKALAAVGGFDERLGAGRWGIEDLTLRMRAAGYAAYISEDLFAHHFPAKDCEPFLNDPSEESRRGEIFAQKWAVPKSNPQLFDTAEAIRRGFDPAKLFVALSPRREGERMLRDAYAAVFTATCGDENELEIATEGLRRYLRAFTASDRVLFALAVGGELNVEAVSARVRAVARKFDRQGASNAPDVAIVGRTAEGKGNWMDRLPAGPRRAIEDLDDLSPSALRRVVTLARGDR